MLVSSRYNIILFCVIIIDIFIFYNISYVDAIVFTNWNVSIDVKLISTDFSVTSIVKSFFITVKMTSNSSQSHGLKIELLSSTWFGLVSQWR